MVFTTQGDLQVGVAPRDTSDLLAPREHPGIATEPTYDGEGRRVQKSWGCSAGNGTCSTVFVYDAMGQQAAEYSTAPNPAPGTTEYLTADSLGSTRLVTDGFGVVTQCYDYLPFGEEIPQGINGRGSCYPPSGVYPHTACPSACSGDQPC